MAKRPKIQCGLVMHLALKLIDFNYFFLLMSHTNKNTFMWEKGWGGEFCPGPECCLPLARPVNRASVREWHRNHGLAVMEYS